MITYSLWNGALLLASELMYISVLNDLGFTDVGYHLIPAYLYISYGSCIINKIYSLFGYSGKGFDNVITLLSILKKFAQFQQDQFWWKWIDMQNVAFLYGNMEIPVNWYVNLFYVKDK